MSLEHKYQNTVHGTQKIPLQRLLKKPKWVRSIDNMKKSYSTKMSKKGKIIKEIIVDPLGEP